MIHRTKTRVRYAETDQGGVAYHSNYLFWFEVGRAELLRDGGLPYSEVERDLGILLTVTEAQLKYHRPALYDDLLVIETSIPEVKRVRMKIATVIRRAEEEAPLCEGHVWLAAVTRTGRVVSIPDSLRSVVTR